MTENMQLNPDYLFEISWEVCNKVGGIYTVISTKANILTEKFQNNYIFIGPDVWKETRENPEFIEDKLLYRSWREEAESEGLHLRIGRWKIPGNPIAVLVDFTNYFEIKDKIFAEFWEHYKLDSIAGQWDYIEPVMFGYAAAKVIESFYQFNISAKDKIIAHFHEWMTGSGILYLKKAVPQVGTLFTTHATAIARSIAANGMPLYKDMENFNADTIAHNFNIVSKQSIEKLSAINSYSFTTVSEITAKECEHFLDKKVDLVTPNGFEDSFIPKNEIFHKKRKEARNKLINVAEAILNQKVAEDTIFICTSGRYEFKNKGIDIFIDALGKLNKKGDTSKQIFAFILVPANHAGPHKDIVERLNKPNFENPISNEYVTHYLHEAESDPCLCKIKENALTNAPGNKVKIIFVPSYLNGNDGVFNESYYDLLIGFDISIFPSYYEPWGYTPMESAAFFIPTITTSLTGFGKWVASKFSNENNAIAVIERTDDNNSQVVDLIVEKLIYYINLNELDKKNINEEANKIASTGLWVNFIENYYVAYHIALKKVLERADLYKNKVIPDQVLPYKTLSQNKQIWRKVLVKSDFPEGLSDLVRLSKNMWWSWNYDAQELFEMIDPILWAKWNYNPVSLLQDLSYEQLLALEKNTDFMKRLSDVYARFSSYMQKGCEKPKEQLAYFSMEYGLHDSIKIFSGGLGVLAGDYLKQASDSNINMVGVGLLYRNGYFTQNLSPTGDQMELHLAQKFSHLPIHSVRVTDNESGKENEWLKIKIALPGRTLFAKVWLVNVGRTPLYLLDTDIDENSPQDRSITFQLYGGDNENRLKQELLLGIGGIRLLDALNHHPTIYHCNEGHAAFIGLERMRILVQEEFFTFPDAMELVRASTLFTTHTPVPAGHDSFSEDLLRKYIPHYAGRLNIDWNTFMNLGRAKENDPNEKFSMSVLAVKLSQEVNGVSRIHGKVSREMFSELFSGFYPEELHIGYVTNGVHYATWTAKRWQELYKKEFGEAFLSDLSNKEYWSNIFNVPDQEIWNIRQAQRKDLIVFLRKRLMENLAKRQENPKNSIDMIEALNEDALTIGFARRFATYKRAYLLFKNLDKLAQIVNNPNMPVQFIFAGKAHPADKEGQLLIKHIVEVSKKKEFLGKILFIENYDMEIASKMVQGVDIWLNTPTRPLEASGTSGQKAIMNGVVNFSVLDGWFAEGYKENAGWALKEETTFENHQFQDELDAETIYDILEDEIIPTFYKRDKDGISAKWISYVKNTIAEVAPQFTTKRMIDDYIKLFYTKLINRSKELTENKFELVKKLSFWKKKIIREWENIEVVSMNIPDYSNHAYKLGEKFVAEIRLNLHDLKPEEIGIEIIFGEKEFDQIKNIFHKSEMVPVTSENNVVIYRTQIFVTRPGVFNYAFRMFPKNSMLPHLQDFNLIRWL